MSHISSLVHFAVARKGSGKTFDIGNRLQELLDKNKITCCYVFSSTAEIDPSWKRIRKMLKKADIPVEIYDSIVSREVDERGREYKVNNLKNVLEDLIPKKEEKKGGSAQGEEEYRYDPTRNVWIYRGSIILPASSYTPSISGGLKPKREKPAPVSPCLIFDDLSKKELRGVDLYNYIKKSRHFGQNGGTSYTFISSQFPTDLQGECWQNLDRLCLFRGFGDEYVRKIYNRTNISIPFNEFLDKYKELTKEQFSKMEIDLRTDKIIS